MIKFLIVLIFFLTACTSLKPIESNSKDIPLIELSTEVQNKFEVVEVKPVTPKKNIPNNSKNTLKKSVKKREVVVPEPEIKVVKKFNPPIGQKLIFAVYAPMGIRAGTLITKVEGIKSINNQEVVLLKANIYNTSFFSSIFKVNLLVESYVEPIEFKSVRYQVTGQEGQLIKNNLELYDYENNTIIEYVSKVEDGVKNTNKTTSQVLNIDTAQDILSSFWKLVSLDFSVQNEYTFMVAAGNELKTAKVVKLADYEDGYILGLSFDQKQNPNDRKIYLNTKTNLVDKIEANIKWGSFKVVRVDNE